MRKLTFPVQISALLFTLVFLPAFGMAQAAVSQPTETLWTNGKIFVVLIVAGTIFAGIGIFLILLERKINRLEKTISDKNL